MFRNPSPNHRKLEAAVEKAILELGNQAIHYGAPTCRKLDFFYVLAKRPGAQPNSRVFPIPVHSFKEPSNWATWVLKAGHGAIFKQRHKNKLSSYAVAFNLSRLGIKPVTTTTIPTDGIVISSTAPKACMSFYFTNPQPASIYATDGVNHKNIELLLYNDDINPRKLTTNCKGYHAQNLLSILKGLATPTQNIWQPQTSFADVDEAVIGSKELLKQVINGQVARNLLKLCCSLEIPIIRIPPTIRHHLITQAL